MTNVIDCILKNSPWNEYWIFIKERQASSFSLFEKGANLLKHHIFSVSGPALPGKTIRVFPYLIAKLEGVLYIAYTLLLKTM